MIRVEIDRDSCIGSGNCLFWASHTFDLDDDARVVIIEQSGDPDDRIRTAVEGCPSKALSIVEDSAP